MAFDSHLFLLGFLPVALVGFHLATRRGRRLARAWLIAASLAFYGWAAPAFLPVLGASVAGNLASARLLHRLAAPAPRRVVLVGAIAANLAALAWFRYLADWLAAADAWFGTGLLMAPPLVPLGISFFTFTQVGYLLDCHAGTEPPRPLADQLVFVTCFPGLIAGPLLTAREMMPQIAMLGRAGPRAEDIARGGLILTIGLLKKTLLADPLAPAVQAGFADPAGLDAAAAWATALSYVLRLYFDFSGYSDMAVGAARMFGLRYPWNFASPYQAASVIAYWQRWHVSLTRFFMATLHTPMTMAAIRRRRARGLGTGRGDQRTVGGFTSMIAAPIAATMLLAGAWHGAGATFLVFGALHAAYLIANHAWRLLRPAAWPRVPLAAVALTHLAVIIAAVVFAAPDLPAAWALLAAMAGANGLGLVAPGLDAARIAVLYALVWLAPNTQAIADGAARWSWQPTRGWAIAAGMAATVGLLSAGGAREFLYFRF